MEMNMPALALTDHGSMFGAVSFYKYARKKGIKPIVGCELYVARGSRLDKRPGGHGAWDTSNHLIALAKDEEGYHNLMKLSSRGYTEGFYYKPRVDLELLSEHSRGILAMSACLKGKLGEDLIGGDKRRAREHIGIFSDIFGRDSFYLEIQRHGLDEEEAVTRGVLELAGEVDLPVVATNDCHYIRKEDARAHDILLCLQTGRDLDDPNRLKFVNDSFYFKSPEEMKELFPEAPEAVTNTLEVAEKCNLEMDLGRMKLPAFPIPEGFASANEYLEHLAVQGLKERYPGAGPEVMARLDYELKIIEQMGYSGYFLIVRDLVDAARGMGIPVGPGRGSAAGSIVSYCLRITDIDPLKFGLLFERFLNPERVSMPDIDIDFCDRRRSEVIEYVIAKYGKNSVSQIITFGTMAARAAIRDVGRVLKVPIDEVDRIAKTVPAEPGMTLDAAMERVPGLKEAAGSEKHGELIELARKLEGLARHASTHAAGVLITPGDLMDHVPLYRGSKGEVVTQYDMNSCESIGLLKMDFLGLTTLSIMDDTLEMVRDRHGVELKLKELPLDDPEVYGMLSEGQTIGVFQLESSGMRDLLRRIAPERFEDIIAINALHRPGPLGSEMVELFIKRKRGEKKIDYEHPMLEPILKESYGVILYQEQVIEIASKMAGFTKGQADILRRAMGKKETAIMDQQRRSFIKGAMGNRIKQDIAERIFNNIAYFAGYGFNKSHSTAYALLSYQTAFLKVKYPMEFMAACLTSEIGNTDRVVILMDECRRMGIKVLPPDVNQSEADFMVTDEGIRFGLAAIKNVGRAAIDAMVEARRKHGEFRTLFDLCEHVDLRGINKRVVESLALSGALDSLEGHRAQLVAGIEMAMGVGQRSQRDRSAGQTSLLQILETHGEKSGITRSLPYADEWSLMEQLNREREVLGFYCSGHPLSRYNREIECFATTTIAGARNLGRNRSVIVAGVISGKRVHIRRDGSKVGFVGLEDLTGQIESIFFDDQINSAGDRLVPGAMVLVSGSMSFRNEDDPKIKAKDFIELEQSAPKLTRKLEIVIDAARFGETALELLTGVIGSNPGPVPVSVVVVSEKVGEVVLKMPKGGINPGRDALAALDNIEGVAAVRLIPKASRGRRRLS
jgi:DNA polymerase-3 subunit alpha